jgi:hypothetical protein
VAVFDQLRHLAEEEGEQQRADMRAVHVGVGHDDDLVVAQLVGCRTRPADAGAERGDQRADLLARLSIRSKRARSTFRILPRSGRTAWLWRAALLGRAAGAVALDEEQLGLGRVLFLAIGELAGQRGHVHRRLAPGQFAGLAGGLARQRRPR